MPAAESADEKPGDAQEKPEAPADYASRLEASLRWGVGGIAAVATSAVAKLSLDRLGKGSLDTALVIWAYAGLAAFSIGVVVIISAVVWSSRSSRVTLSYLLGPGRIAEKVRDMINESKYLLGGQANLLDLRKRLTELVRKPGETLSA